jgi:LuxR family transcriptional regulator, maltose regulon positive regulatory protein
MGHSHSFREPSSPQTLLQIDDIPLHALAQFYAMSDAKLAFARTKIKPPRQRADLIDRGALQTQMSQALQQQKLVLLLAPAGWGKTSALARQLAILPPNTRVAWVSADEEDDVPRLLAALTAALEPLELSWRVSPAALGTLALGSRGVQQAAAEVVNALAEAEVTRGLLILDDIHRIADLKVFDFLSALADWLPERWGLVLSSRTEPPLAFARWRARGELSEFRQADLRFSADEVKDMLRARGDNIDRADELHRSTEGWAAGLRLMISVGAKAGSVSGRQHVYDFLADEVLAGMDERLRLFLLRCSVLPELTPTRCTHVCAMPDAQEHFEKVEREGLFVTPLDDTTRTLRLHDLFRNFLEDRLQRDHAAELPGLLQRAAEHEPDLVRAVTWLVRAGAWGAAASTLAARGPVLVSQGGGLAIERLLGLFAPASFGQDPRLHLLRGLCAIQAFDFELIGDAMRQAAEGLDHIGMTNEAALARAYQHMAGLSSGQLDASASGMAALHARGLDGPAGALAAYYCGWTHYAMMKPEAAAGYIDIALAHLERVQDASAWQPLYLVGFLASLPRMGPVLERFVRGAMLVAGECASLLRLGVQQVRCALALREGRVGEARDWLASADDEMRWLGNPRSALNLNTMLHFAINPLVGDEAACRKAATEIRTDFHNSTPEHRRTHAGTALLCEVRCAWALGDTAWVREAVADRLQAANAFEWPIGALECSIARGMLALIDGRDAEAEQALMPPSGAIERLPALAGGQSVVLCVEAQRRQGRLDAASELLTRWFDSLDAGEPVGGALLAGPAVLTSVAGVAWGDRLAPSRQQRLRDLAAQARALREEGLTPAPDLSKAHVLGGLTEREAEVLDLLAQGQSNKLIARALDLSPFTVKRHVANILNKTATTSRTEVATWWVAQRG